MVGNFWRHALMTIDRMDMQDWVMVLFSMIVVAFVCMRGFGSRTNY